MEPTLGKPPVKKRRRWLIVAFILVLVLVPLVMWWYSPKIDGTLVGNWKVTLGDLPERSFGPLWLKSDGTGLIVVREGRDEARITRTFSFEWRVMGGNFVILGQNNSRFKLWDRAMAQAYAYTQSPIFLSNHRFAVHRYDSSRVHLAAWGRSPSFLPRNLTIVRQAE